MRRTPRRAPDRLRVLLVCGELRPGLDGVSDAVVRLSAALRAADAAVRIVHVGPPSGRPGARTVGERWAVRSMLAAHAAMRGADVVHVQFAPSMVRFRAGLGLLPLVLGRRPLVTTLHEYGWWRWERRLPITIWRVLERAGLADRETALLVPLSRAVVVTNPAHRGDLRRRFPRIEPVTIPIGANVEVAPAGDRSAVRASLDVPEDAVVVAFFGFVHPVKGVRYLAEAVAELVAEGRDLHLLVIGGFESLALPADEARAFEAELRGQIEDADLGARTTITGFQEPERISHLLAASDVAVLPFTAGVTTKSGSLLTVLAHGLPTVVTAPPDDPDPELADGGRVLVVPEVRSGPALAAGLRRMLEDPELARRIATAGREWAAERDWTRIAERHLAIYGALT